MRIVSLVPAATEIVYALGLGDELVGRSHACDYPEDVAAVSVVTEPPVAQDSGSRQIHEAMRTAARGGSVRTLDPARLAELEPDLVLTQGLCDVCAIGEQEVREAVAAMHRPASVVSLDALSIEGIFNSISTVGAFAEAEDEAVGLVEILRERLGGLENAILERRLQGVPARRAVVLEWLDPPFAAGHWIPEMVRRAGGWELLGREGERSVRTSWERVREVEPEVIVLALCGFGAERAEGELRRAALPSWFDELEAVREGSLYAVDGAGLFSRPGPRVIDGVAVLAELFDPEAFAGSGPSEAWIPLGPRHIGVGRRG